MFCICTISTKHTIPVVVVVFVVVVVVDVTLLHTTLEGSGLHLPSSPQTTFEDGMNPSVAHWSSMTEPTVVLDGFTFVPLRMKSPQSTAMAGEQSIFHTFVDIV